MIEDKGLGELQLSQQARIELERMAAGFSSENHKIDRSLQKFYHTYVYNLTTEKFNQDWADESNSLETLMSKLNEPGPLIARTVLIAVKARLASMDI